MLSLIYICSFHRIDSSFTSFTSTCSKGMKVICITYSVIYSWKDVASAPIGYYRFLETVIVSISVSAINLQHSIPRNVCVCEQSPGIEFHLPESNPPSSRLFGSQGYFVFEIIEGRLPYSQGCTKLSKQMR